MHQWYIFGTIYFEFPKVRENGFIISAGSAALTTAQLVHEAEEQTELEFLNNVNAPSALQLRIAFTNNLKSLMQGYGARASKNPHYGFVPINPASYIELGYGDCD